MGYLRIDDRASGGQLREYDTSWCRHCQAIIKQIDHAIESGFWCSDKACNGPICNHCADKAAKKLVEHKPFKQVVDEQLERNYQLSKMGF